MNRNSIFSCNSTNMGIGDLLAHEILLILRRLIPKIDFLLIRGTVFGGFLQQAIVNYYNPSLNWWKKYFADGGDLNLFVPRDCFLNKSSNEQIHRELVKQFGCNFNHTPKKLALSGSDCIFTGGFSSCDITVILNVFIDEEMPVNLDFVCNSLVLRRQQNNVELASIVKSVSMESIMKCCKEGRLVPIEHTFSNKNMYFPHMVVLYSRIYAMIEKEWKIEDKNNAMILSNFYNNLIKRVNYFQDMRQHSESVHLFFSVEEQFRSFMIK